MCKYPSLNCKLCVKNISNVATRTNFKCLHLLGRVRDECWLLLDVESEFI